MFLFGIEATAFGNVPSTLLAPTIEWHLEPNDPTLLILIVAFVVPELFATLLRRIPFWRVIEVVTLCRGER